MSAEIGGLVGKFVYAAVAGVVAHIYWLLRKDKNKLDNTYTKEETEQLINLKLDPIIEKVDVMYEMLRKIDNGIDAMNTSVAVVKNDMDHVKDSVKELKQNKKDRQYAKS